MKFVYITFIFLLTIVVSDLNSFLSELYRTTGFLSPLILLLTIFLLGTSLMISKERLPFNTKYFIIIFVYWLVLGSIIFYAYKPGYGSALNKIRYYLPSVLMFYTFAVFFNYYIKRNKLYEIINTLTGALVLNCLFIIYSDIIGLSFGIEENTSGRNSGFIASVNQAGVASSITQVVVLFQLLISYKTGASKIVLFICYLIAVYAGFLTFSKAAFFNIIFILLLFFIYLNKSSNVNQNDRTAIKRISFFFTCMFVLVIIAVNSRYKDQIDILSRYQVNRIEEFKLLLTGEFNEDTTTGRSRIASISFNEIKKDWFFGRGLSTFHSLPETDGFGTHNQYLLLLGEVGFVGLILYCFFFINILNSVFKRNISIQIKFITIGLISVFLITSLVSHNIFFIKLYIIIMALLSVITNENNNKIYNY